MTESNQAQNLDTKPEYKMKIAVKTALNVIWIHFVSIYVLYLICKGQINYKTLMFVWMYGFLGQLGSHAGGHRLWCHRSYKAKLPLRLILIWWQTISAQNSIYEWTRDHRGHHKYSETDADPHNAKRGVFFSHIGWLMVRKHPEVIRAGKLLDLSDLESDPLIMFQHKYYKIICVILTWGGPTVFQWVYFGETLINSTMLCVFRYVVFLHCTFLVNSWAHLYGHRPYDKNINPTETMTVSILSGGEGWHNYHHTFPWDYKASEFGGFSSTTAFIDICARLGLVYGRKVVGKDIIRKKMLNTGDGSNYRH